MPGPRYAFCVFCDDLRVEIGNKLSFMGVYSGDMIFPPGAPPGVPVVVPRFAIIAWLISDIDDMPERVLLKVTTPPGSTEIFRNEISGDQIPSPGVPREGSTRYVLQITMPITNLPLQSDGNIEVIIETERETLRAGRLRVVIPRSPDSTVATATGAAASPPTALPPPSGQSPDVALESKPSRARRPPSNRRTSRTPAPE